MTVTERTYQELLRRIVDGDISPGTVIEERKLAEAMEVSRTPLRSALTQLLGEGLLERLSNGALAVRAFSSTHLMELLQIRLLLECEAAANAAGRIPAAPLVALTQALNGLLSSPERQSEWDVDEQVHELIAEHCGNQTLKAMLLSIKRQSALCHVEQMPNRATQAREEHLKIVQALRDADPQAARQAMAEHLRSVQQNFVRSVTGALR
ncbi:MAG TPA: GntR family transcriptional regulator [Pseudorhodoferax sp.]|nr:GntR family transcriptional regulator [Pseudorhodoferax sp.]